MQQPEVYADADSVPDHIAYLRELWLCVVTKAWDEEWFTSWVGLPQNEEWSEMLLRIMYGLVVKKQPGIRMMSEIHVTT